LKIHELARSITPPAPAALSFETAITGGPFLYLKCDTG
jgi:hypothetical protein